MTQLNDTIEMVLASAVANAGTLVINYPALRDAGSYALIGHEIIVLGARLRNTADFTVSFGTASITVTNASGETWPKGATLVAMFVRAGDADAPVASDRMRDLKLIEVNLGAPDTADVDGVFTAFSGAAGAITLNGALASGGVVTFDVPRNIVIDSGGADTAVLTFVGEDEYGVAMSEAITLNGTTAVAGKKAFKTITSCTSSATISNGAFAGNGDVLGLPVYIPATGSVVRELQDGAAATAGTVVAGVITEATTTTGDVRGTYDPNAACDGSRQFKLHIEVTDPANRGVPQA